MSKKVLITGITGQDGSFLARDLLNKGYEVYGAVRRGSTPKTGRLDWLNVTDDIKFVGMELTEYANILSSLEEIKPDYIYNLAAQSFVADSFTHPHLTAEIDFIGVLNLLEAIKLIQLDCHFYQASTSEMYGDVLADPQDEETPFNPMSPYAVAKCAAHHLVKNYRVAYDFKASSGILFNHESELRGREFVTRKITSMLAKIKLGSKKPVRLGNLSSVRDWGYAPDYVEGMQLICEAQDKNDYVIATNKIVTVREFFSLAAKYLDFEPVFSGEGHNEKCIDDKTGQELCVVDPAYFRPSDVNYLRGSYNKINKELGWMPKTSVEDMAKKMVESDLEIISKKINL